MKKFCFIALIFDEETKNEINGIKIDLKNKFGVKHSLNVEPHITLYEPRWIKDIEKLKEEMELKIKDFGKIALKIEGYNSFEKKVIYIKAIKNSKLLAIYEKVRNMDSLNFIPHITLAHRDIKNFEELWGYINLKKFEKDIVVEKMAIFSLENSKWEIMKLYTL